MHPITAARLVASLSGPNTTVLDPFCGSGTVLVEAMIAGRRAVGADLNPLAVMLAALKTARPTGAQRDAIGAGARAIAAVADERRRRKAGATRRYAAADAALFAPHVLLELDSLRSGLEGATDVDPFVRDALRLVLSGILVKVSLRASDTSGAAVARRIAGGYPARLFVRKAQELARRLTDLDDRVAPSTPPARVQVDDATRLQSVAASTIDAVVTSPPYVGTYDYLAHHAVRLRWLGLDAADLARREMGARRHYAPLDAASARVAWARELGGSLRAMARVCRKGAMVTLVVADSAVRDEALRADQLVSEVAAAAGLAFVARASQPRPHFHGDTARAFAAAPRAEHAIALERR